MEASGGASSSEGKQRLLPWIVAQIEGGQIEGLHWLNDEKTLFQIPWTHKGRQEWNEDSGRIFMEYEKHTGRYQDGCVKPLDYAKSKTRLRCALHKSQDFRCIEDPKVQINENVRVYEVLRRPSTKLPNYQLPASPFSSQQNSPMAAREPQIPASVAAYSANSLGEGHLPSDLELINTSEMLLGMSMLEPMNISMDTDINMISDNMRSLNIRPNPPPPVTHTQRIIDADCHVGVTRSSLDELLSLIRQEGQADEGLDLKHLEAPTFPRDSAVRDPPLYEVVQGSSSAISACYETNPHATVTGISNPDYTDYDQRQLEPYQNEFSVGDLQATDHETIDSGYSKFMLQITTNPSEQPQCRIPGDAECDPSVLAEYWNTDSINSLTTTSGFTRLLDEIISQDDTTEVVDD